MDTNDSCSEAKKNINFTAIVVTYDEDRRLKDCLRSLHFCNQVIVADLGSSDSSVDIAKKLGTEVLHVERMPVVEQVHVKVIENARNDWVILSDPDEVMPDGIENDLRFLISNESSLGLISVPLQHYFKGKELSCTIWGSKKLAKPLVLHKSRNVFGGKVHSGTHLINGFSSVVLLRRHDNYIKHYWIDSYRQLFEKHWRYIRKEGESRYSRGERFSVHRLFSSTISAFKHSLITCNGYHNVTGIFLSLFYSWYVLMGILSLRQYQKDHKKNIQNPTQDNRSI